MSTGGHKSSGGFVSGFLDSAGFVQFGMQKFEVRKLDSGPEKIAGFVIFHGTECEVTLKEVRG